MLLAVTIAAPVDPGPLGILGILLVAVLSGLNWSQVLFGLMLAFAFAALMVASEWACEAQEGTGP